MNLSDTATLLTMCAAFDRRTIGETDVTAWQQVLSGVDLEDAKSTVLVHYARTREWIMPADVLAGVKAIRRERLDRTVEAVPVADPDDVPAYLAEVREGRRETAAMGTSADRLRVAEMVEPAFRQVGGSR